MKSFKLNPLNAVDSYKTSHFKMYTEGTEIIYSNLTPRSDRLFVNTLSESVKRFYDNKITFFGLQGALQTINCLWNEEFFQKPKADVCSKYAARLVPFAGGMTVDVSHFEDLHDVGYLPIEVRALPEGSQVPMGVPVFTVQNLDRKFGWLTNYLETWFSNEIWKPSTIATIAKAYRNMLTHYAKETGSPLEFVSWQGHDFSCRGMSGMYDAASSSTGHLVSFLGSDTISAVDYAEWAYAGDMTFVAGSVPASEHSVMTLDGEEGETELFRRLITEVVPTGIVSLVADGYDYWKVLTETIPALKTDILARQPDAMGFAKVVVRPDSGDPVKIVCGYSDEELSIVDGVIRVRNADGSVSQQVITEAERKGSIEVLWEIFGGTITGTGHKLLDSHIGLIYGDSITLGRMHLILETLSKKGFASANVVFGIGSYTYQYMTRDTFGFAMKATYAEVNGQPRNIFKAPKTDSGAKKSAKGLLAVVRDANGEFHLQQECTIDQVKSPDNCMKRVFSCGEFVKYQSLKEIRETANPDFVI